MSFPVPTESSVPKWWINLAHLFRTWLIIQMSGNKHPKKDNISNWTPWVLIHSYVASLGFTHLKEVPLWKYLLPNNVEEQVHAYLSWGQCQLDYVILMFEKQRGVGVDSEVHRTIICLITSGIFKFNTKNYWHACTAYLKVTRILTNW